VNLSQKEDWIWLFSDDDVMSEDCVAGFYRALEQNPSAKLFRFRKKMIDEKGNVISELKEDHHFLNAEKFLTAKMNFRIHSMAVEYIFHRSLFELYRFVDFPLGWFSDDATWALYAKEQGICPIGAGFVSWRASRYNLSSFKISKSRSMIRSMFRFREWLGNNFPEVWDRMSANERAFWYAEHIRIALSTPLSGLSLAWVPQMFPDLKWPGSRMFVKHIAHFHYSVFKFPLCKSLFHKTRKS
jgi:hypothetical protein